MSRVLSSVDGSKYLEITAARLKLLIGATYDLRNNATRLVLRALLPIFPEEVQKDLETAISIAEEELGPQNNHFMVRLSALTNTLTFTIGNLSGDKGKCAGIPELRKILNIYG